MSIKLTGFLDKTGKEEARVKEEIETRYYAVIKLKKIAYDKFENQKNETGDPWVNVKITSLDQNKLSELFSKSKGDAVQITIG